MQKQKYESKKSRLLASSALLTHNCVCWGLVANGCLPVIWEQDPGFLGYSERLYHDAMISKWPDPTQDCRWVGQPCKFYAPNQSSRCKCCHSSSLRIFTCGSTTYRTTLEILARQQSLCHAKLGVSHPLAARQSPGSKALNTDRWLFFLLSYFFLYTSVLSTCLKEHKSIVLQVVCQLLADGGWTTNLQSHLCAKLPESGWSVQVMHRLFQQYV